MRPYPPLGMTTQRWEQVPVRYIPLQALTPTQQTRDDWVQAKLRDPRSSESGDRFPHAVVHGRRVYIEDGHHRVEMLRRLGALTVPVRLVAA